MILFHRLIVLSFCVHLYFWIAFQRKAPFRVHFLFALVALVYCAFVLLGPITDPRPALEQRFKSLDTVQWPIWQILQFLLGAPACALLMASDTSLCNQNTYFSHLIRSFSPFENEDLHRKLRVPRKKCIVLFHNRQRSFDWPSLFRVLPNEYGGFRIFQSYNQSRFLGFYWFLSWLFNGVQVNRPSKTFQKVANTEDVPCVFFVDGPQYALDTTFSQPIHSIAIAAALGLDVYDIYEGTPSEANLKCVFPQIHMQHFSREHLDQFEQVPTLSYSSSAAEYMEWFRIHKNTIAKQLLHLETSYKDFLEKDSQMCSQSRLDFSQTKSSTDQRRHRSEQMCKGL